MAGDYICRALNLNDKNVDSNSNSSSNSNESATIKLRMAPYIEEFGVHTSHSGKSCIISEGEKLELNCQVRDTTSPVNITWFKSSTPDDEKTMIPISEIEPPTTNHFDNSSPPIPSQSQASGLLSSHPTYIYTAEPSITIEKKGKYAKKLVINSIRPGDRSYYVCMADNGVTERSRKMILVRVKDKLVALWPMLGIIAELVILFAIIYIWDTERAYKELSEESSKPLDSSPTSKRQPVGPSTGAECVPLTSD